MQMDDGRTVASRDFLDFNIGLFAYEFAQLLTSVVSGIKPWMCHLRIGAAWGIS